MQYKTKTKTTLCAIQKNTLCNKNTNNHPSTANCVQFCAICEQNICAIRFKYIAVQKVVQVFVNKIQENYCTVFVYCSTLSQRTVLERLGSQSDIADERLTGSESASLRTRMRPAVRDSLRLGLDRWRTTSSMT